MSVKAREKKIIHAGITGVVTNILLASFKLAVGITSHSIAIVADAVNNAGDMLSSAVTVVGARLAGRPADREHPLGHGRIEYVSAAIVAAVILYAGITALVESVQRALHPVQPEYSVLSLIVVGTAVVVKLILGRYIINKGNELNSDSLLNSGRDALFDALISALTLAAAVVFMVSGLSLEAWLGMVISAFIIKAGIDMFRQTVSKLLGERVESGLAKAIKATICETEGVYGAYDLILNSYGPDHWFGSVNIEVPDTWTADRIDAVTRDIVDRVSEKNSVFLTAVGIYSRNSTSDIGKEVRARVTEAVMGQEYVLQIHGFYCDVQAKSIRFHLVTDFLAPDAGAVYERVLEETRALYPDYNVEIHMDSDYSD